MPRYIDPKYNPKIIYMGMDELGNEIYHVPTDVPTVDVVDKELYDKLLENSIIISEALNKYQSADMVEVVRCKYCKFWHREIRSGIEYFNFSSCDLNHHGDGNNFYCGDGKRKDDGIQN